MQIKIKKKNGSVEVFDTEKIKVAVSRAADRIGQQLDSKTINKIIAAIKQDIHTDLVNVFDMHKIVCGAIKQFAPDVAASYQNFRDYKMTYAQDFEKLFQQAKDVLLLGDRENANFDSSLVSTKGSLIRGYTTSMLYKKFYLHHDEAAAIRRGDIYIHDLRDQIMASYNCIDGSGWVTIKVDGEIKSMTLDQLREYLNVEQGIFGLSGNIQILSRNGWQPLQIFAARKIKSDELLYTFKTKNGLGLSVTGKHRIPVINKDGVEQIKNAEDITTEDQFIMLEDGINIESHDSMIDLCDYADPKTYVGGLRFLKRYFEYKFDKSLQQFCRENDIFISKNLNSIELSKFNQLKKLISIPYDVYNKLYLKKKGAKRNIPLLLPVSEELARMFGYIFSDGHVGKGQKGEYHIVFSNTDKQLIDDFVNCSNIVFPDVNVLCYQPYTTNCYNVIIANGVIWDLFHKYKKSNGDITIPDFIFNGTKDIQNAFISAAWDDDGYFRSDGSSTGYSTCCQKYSEQIVMLLQNMGYNPTTVSMNTKGKPYNFKHATGTKNYDIFHVKIEKYEDVLKFKNTTTSYKNKLFTLKERAPSYGRHNRVTEITTSLQTAEKYVYDLTTGDSWVLVNNYVVHNCSLFNIEAVLKDGFEMSNIRYREPSSVLSALQVIGDITLVSTAQQFGGFTLSELDRVLTYYAKKTLETARKEYDEFVGDGNEQNRENFAWKRLTRELTQGFQGLELKLNTVPCSRGDFAFTTITFGAMPKNASELDKKIQRYICEIILKTRKDGHNGIPVVFPKLVYLFSKKQHEDPLQMELFEKALQCSAETMYPRI